MWQRDSNRASRLPGGQTRHVLSWKSGGNLQTLFSELRLCTTLECRSLTIAQQVEHTYTKNKAEKQARARQLRHGQSWAEKISECGLITLTAVCVRSSAIVFFSSLVKSIYQFILNKFNKFSKNVALCTIFSPPFISHFALGPMFYKSVIIALNFSIKKTTKHKKEPKQKS